MGFGVWGLGFGVWGLGSGSGSGLHEDAPLAVGLEDGGGVASVVAAEAHPVGQLVDCGHLGGMVAR